jgi:hypothetical protein
VGQVRQVRQGAELVLAVYPLAAWPILSNSALRRSSFSPSWSWMASSHPSNIHMIGGPVGNLTRVLGVIVYGCAAAARQEVESGSSPTYWAKPVRSIRFQSPVGSRRRSMNGRMPEYLSQGVTRTTERYLGCKQKLRCAVNDSDWHRARRCQAIGKRRGYRPPLGDKRVSIFGISIRGRRPPQSDMPTTRSDGTPIRCPPTGPSQSVYQARHRPIAVARSQPINSDRVPI